MARSFTAASSENGENGAAVLTAEPITMACRFLRSATGAVHDLISLNTTSGNDHRFTLSVSNIDLLRATARSTSSGVAAGTTTIVSDTWHHGAGVFTSSIRRDVYLNGVNEGNNTTPITVTAPNRTQVGKGATGEYWQGYIAEVGIWSIALNASEIASLSRGCSPLLIRPMYLEAYYPLLGYASTEIDLMSPGKSLTMTGTTVVAHPYVIYPRKTKVHTPPAAAFDAALMAAIGQRRPDLHNKPWRAVAY